MRPNTYLQALLNTFSSPQYYIRVLHTRGWFSLRFFLISYALIAFVLTGLFAFRTAPQLQTSIEEVRNELVARYPSDLTLNWNGQRLSTNRTQPIEIPYPTLFADASWREDFPKTLGYILPNDVSVEDVGKQLPHSSIFVLSPSTVFVNAQSGEWSDLPLTDLLPKEEIRVTHDSLPNQSLQWAKELIDIIDVIKIMYWPAVFVWLVLIRLITLAFDVGLVFICLLIFNRKVRFANLYRIGLHVIVVAEVAEIVGRQLTPNGAFPYFATTFWIFFSLALYQVWQSQQFGKRSAV